LPRSVEGPSVVGMADAQILNPGCDDDCDDDDKEGKRGKRGHRGHRGHRGPGGRGLLKFSGAVNSAEGPTPVVSYLADHGSGLGGPSVLLTAQGYPVATTPNLRNLAVNLLGFTVPSSAQLIVELLKNGSPVPGFVVTYNPGETGVHFVAAGPVAFAPPDTFDLRVTTINLGGVVVNLSATVGVE
jgi:hypothetical protein